MAAYISAVSGRAIEQHGTNMTNRLRWIQALGAHVDAVLNAVAAKHAKRIIQLGQSILCRRVTTVGEESIRLQQTGGTDKSIGIPPERRTACRTASAKNALVESIELGSVFRGL